MYLARKACDREVFIIDSRPFFCKGRKVNKVLFCYSRKLTSYGKFGSSRPDLDGNNLAKRIYLVRKACYREVFVIDSWPFFWKGRKVN